MKLHDERHVSVEGKGEYENAIEDGKEVEWLNGVGLMDGHYCKHYRWTQDWSDAEHTGQDGTPFLRFASNPYERAAYQNILNEYIQKQNALNEAK